MWDTILDLFYIQQKFIDDIKIKEEPKKEQNKNKKNTNKNNKSLLIN